MTNIVKIVSEKELHTIMEYYEKQGALLAKLPPGALFSAKVNNVTITGYRSKKVMFQGQYATQEANKFQFQDAPVTKAKKQVKKQKHDLPPQFQTLSVIGSDEVGTGDYFGPFIVASAFCASDKLPYLASLGVKDSKQLSDDTIIKLARTLTKEIPYSLLVVPNEKYNALHEKGMNQVKLKAILHNQALYLTREKIKPQSYDAILIDQFVKKETYFSYINKETHQVKERVYFATKGESRHLAVACASIIARAAFLQRMDQLSKQLGITLPKGAGKNVDQVASHIIRAHGEKTLRQYAKIHFANTEKAKQL